MTHANMDTSTSWSAVSPKSSSLHDAFQSIMVLVACYVGLGLLGFGATVLLRDHPQLVNTAVWVRGSIVLATSALMYRFAAMAARGKRSAFLRLRIASITIPLAIAVIIALPDPFPVWMKVQQGLCALVIAGVAALANRRFLREYFAR